MSDEGLQIFGELIGSLIVDAMGLLSYFLPIIGEASDVATAPITVAWIFEMVNDVESGGSEAEVLAGFGGIEELAPLIDIIPSATIAWAYKLYVMK